MLLVERRLAAIDCQIAACEARAARQVELIADLLPHATEMAFNEALLTTLHQMLFVMHEYRRLVLGETTRHWLKRP
jgi:hypothetical protein